MSHIQNTASPKIYLKQLSRTVLINYLRDVDNDFAPKLSSKINLNDFANKLLHNATFCIASIRGKVVGLIAFYCNDCESNTAYISLVSVKIDYRKAGISKSLLMSVFEHCRKVGMKRIALQTNKNSLAESIYLKMGFQVEEIFIDEHKYNKVRMSLDLNDSYI